MGNLAWIPDHAAFQIWVKPGRIDRVNVLSLRQFPTLFLRRLPAEDQRRIRIEFCRLVPYQSRVASWYWKHFTLSLVRALKASPSGVRENNSGENR